MGTSLLNHNAICTQGGHVHTKFNTSVVIIYGSFIKLYYK